MSSPRHMTGPVTVPESKQSNGFVLTCVLTVLVAVGLLYIWYLLTTSPGTFLKGTPPDSESVACPAVSKARFSFSTEGGECAGAYAGRLARAILLAIPVVTIAAVTLSRWITHMGLGAKPLEIKGLTVR